MLKEGKKLEDGPLKESMEVPEFIYMEGISRMGHNGTRHILSVAGANTQAIKDTSFVGGSVCSLLTEKTYRGELVKLLHLKKASESA